MMGGAGYSGAGPRSGSELGAGERRAELEFTNKGVESCRGSRRPG